MPRISSQAQQLQSTRPFITPEGQLNHLVSLAYDLAEQRLREGTASSQEVTHFLKEGGAKARLELVKLEEENKLLRAKTESLQSLKRMDEIYSEAIAAMRRYAGQGEPGDQNEDY